MTDLPCTDPARDMPTPLARSERNGAFELEGRRIVIVEDEGITQMQLQKILRNAGASVVGTAPDGRAAVDVVLKERPDLVLMDIQMPIMNGLDAAEQILQSLDTCIVMLTAYSDDDNLQRANSIGTGGFLIKPITAGILLPQLAAAYATYHSR
jgi:response regulator NasT